MKYLPKMIAVPCAKKKWRHSVNLTTPIKTEEDFLLKLENAKLDVKKQVYDKIVSLGVRVSEAYNNDSKNGTDVFRTLDFDKSTDVCELSDLMNEKASIFSKDSYRNSHNDEVMKELQTYLNDEAGKGQIGEEKHVLEYWKKKSVLNPILSHVARVVLGAEVSAGAVELDIGIGGMYLPKHRLSTSAQNVEMQLFIKRNMAFMDWNSIKSVEPSQMGNFLPTAPTIPFVEQYLEEDEKFYKYTFAYGYN